MINNTIDTEVWKDIEGYEGYYQVSNLGRIRSLDRLVKSSFGAKRTVKGQIIKVSHDKRGYLKCGLRKDGKKKTFKVHRLVGKHFVNNPKMYTEINHKDEDKYNNRADNLEWCTRKHNSNYGTTIERAQSNKNTIEARNKQKVPVVQFDLNNRKIKEYSSIAEAAKENNLHKTGISGCINNRLKTSGGYIWRKK